MNSLYTPGSDDKLARLVQATLKAQVGGYEPPRRVWKRVKLQLERDHEPFPGQCDDVGLADVAGPIICQAVAED